MKHKIYGPPGTGKTTRLIELLEKEIKDGVPPERIAFLTFTRAARAEALARTEKTEAEFPYLRTIHSICYRQLGISQNQIVKPHNLRTFGKLLGLKLNGNNLDPWIEEFSRTWDPPTRDDLLIQINHCGRHRGLLLKDSLNQAKADIDYKYAVWVTKAYRSWKDTNGVLDYTDLLMKYIDYGKPLDIDVIFVDEAQDLSSLQWEVVDKLGAKAKRMYLCGDDDQAIFHWAGADSSAFQNYKTDTEEILHQSFRVSKSVHATAQRIASRIQVRIPKEYFPTESEGEVINIGYLEAADFSQKTFVLFRNHYRGYELGKILNDQGIPYIGHGSPLTESDVRLCLQAWYNLIKKREINKAECKKLLKYCDPEYTFIDYKRSSINREFYKIEEIFINPPLWNWWPKYLSKLPGVDIIEGFVHRAGFLRTSKPKVELMSIHQSKGREAHTVVLDTEISRVVYDNYTYNADEENRVFYVAVTRAKERVMILMPSGYFNYNV